jgi:hypothetical protein
VAQHRELALYSDIFAIGAVMLEKDVLGSQVEGMQVHAYGIVGHDGMNAGCQQSNQ